MAPEQSNSGGLKKFAWFVVAYNLLVIAWGAYVRATSSGAGCGNDWPRCSGGVTANTGDFHQLVEYTHRLSSGLSLVFAIILLIWVFRRTNKGHWTRITAVAAVCFLFAEALIGALLVLGGFVTTNSSAMRAVVLCWHFANTLLLLASLTLTAHWIGAPHASGRVRLEQRSVWVPLILLLLAGTTGAMAALGDTLFPSTSFGSALQQDLSSSSHFLIRWRILHPLSAIAAAVLIMVFLRRAKASGRLASWMPKVGHALIGTQLLVGFANAGLRAPLPLQMVHLVLADSIWIVMVLCAASMAISRADAA